MRRSLPIKTTSLGVLILLVGILAYAAVGPFITMYQIKVEIDNHDGDKLNANIDFQALRANLKEQLNVMVMKKAGTDLQDNPIGGLVFGMASKASEEIVDSIVTPEGLSAAIEGRKHKKNEARDSSQVKTKSFREFLQQFDYEFESTSRFIVWLKDKKKAAKFVLERQRLSWKLNNVLIPG
jgi:uncharacterized protein YneF (UPF0154 family)